MYTTVRVSNEVKKKAEALKGKLSFDSYISKMNLLVESQNIDLSDVGENIPRLIKDRTAAVIKILKAFEKQYLLTNKKYLELLIDEKEPVEVQNVAVQKSNKEPELLREIEALKLENNQLKNKQPNIAVDKKNELLQHIHEIEKKGEFKQKGNNHEMVYSSFFLKQKLDLLANKINAL